MRALLSWSRLLSRRPDLRTWTSSVPNIISPPRTTVVVPPVTSFCHPNTMTGVIHQMHTGFPLLNSQTEEAAKNPGEGATPSDGPSDGEKLKGEIEKLTSENAAFKEKHSLLEEKYLRALAESENLRNRLTKQIADMKQFAIHGFAKDLTEIVDVLNMAIQSVPKDQVNNENVTLKQLYEGVCMTEARLMQVFKSHGMSPINPVDAKFNPNEHQAVVQQVVEGKESGTVIFVSKVGYKLNDRVVRPAMVGVAK